MRQRSYVDVARILGVSPQRIRQLERAALYKLSVLFLDELSEVNPALCLTIIAGMPQPKIARIPLESMTPKQLVNRKQFERRRKKQLEATGCAVARNG
jgi:hypothetical protein